MASERKKIAILGGGIAGLATAWRLLRTPELAARHEVTIHQMGWRLGGKCATGRDPRHGQRIEEHGIHGFMGSYHNALPMMREVYDAWWLTLADDAARARPHPLARFEDAFVPENCSYMWERHASQDKRWPVFPDPRRPLPQRPHDLIEMAPQFATAESWIRTVMANAREMNPDAGTTRSDAFEAFTEAVEQAVENGTTDLASAVQAGRETLEKALGKIEAQSDAARRQRLIAEYFTILITGFARDNLETRGFAAVDDEDCFDWLARHGASADLLVSPIVQSPIFVTYQYVEGDVGRRPVMSAAAYLQWVLRTPAALGARYYLFAAGSGETIVTPLYQALLSRGAKFRFFHRVEALEAGPGGKAVSRVRMVRQVAGPIDDYRPTVPVKGLDCWPNAPVGCGLDAGEGVTPFDLEDPLAKLPNAMPFDLEAGRDFDHLVLAIPVGALPGVVAPLVEAAPAGVRGRWQQMLGGARTVATHSMQLWLRDKVADLGLKDVLPDPAKPFLLAGNHRAGPHGHVDFSKVLPWEDWVGEAPRGALQFSGVLPEVAEVSGTPAYHHAMSTAAKASCETMLRAAGGEILPGLALASHPFSLDFDRLHAPDAPVGEPGARLAQQYIRVNAVGPERYTQSPPRLLRSRIKPNDSGFLNLSLAGDWTDFGLNVGSFEGAVMSAMIAAHGAGDGSSLEEVIGLMPTAGDRARWTGPPDAD
jgi:uncharacterized protein with NAD-binding domain and iron-sulfur cluster